MNTELNAMKKQYEKSSQTLKESYDKQLKQKTKEFESKLAGVSSEKRTEQNMHK